MASLRKSPRNASPADAQQGVPILGTSSSIKGEKVDSAAHSPSHPPPPSTIAPIFEDARSNGRPAGMRDGMSQFRANPPQPKVKLRVKQYDPARKAYIARNDDGSDTKETVKNTERGLSRKGINDKTEDKTRQNGSLSKQSEDDTESVLKPPGKITPSNPSPTIEHKKTTLEDLTPENLSLIVDLAIEKCYEHKDEITGLALRHLHNESLINTHIDYLLKGTLLKSLTSEEASEFQKFMHIARKKVKKELKKSTTPSVSKASKPPSTTLSIPDISVPKSANRSPVRRTRASARTERLSVDREEIKVTLPMPSTFNGKRTNPEVEALKSEEPPTKRAKRSKSVSSISSLSSLGSNDVDPDVEMSEGPRATRSTAKKTATKESVKAAIPTKYNLKKPLGSLDPPKFKDKEKFIDSTELKELADKKRKLARNDFEDYEVEPSNLRSVPKPRLPKLGTDDATFPNLQPSSSNATGKRVDPDELHSPASSAHDELLVPPPLEARRSSRSRGATPSGPRTRGVNERVKARVKES
jgi:hypothetical protein